MSVFMLVFGGIFLANELFVWMDEFISDERMFQPSNPFDLDEWD